MAQGFQSQSKSKAVRCSFCGNEATEYVPFDRAPYYTCPSCSAKIAEMSSKPSRPSTIEDLPEHLRDGARRMYEGRD